jgi:serine/threonine protein kinase
MVNSGARLAAGERIGSYRIVGHLVGDTYRAIHVAVPRRALIDVGSVDNWRQVGMQMLRAQLLVEQLQHPGIARIVERGMLADRRPWIATEVPSGLGLYDLVARRAMPTTEMVALIRDVADVLAYAHSLDVIHRALTFRSIVLATGARAFPIAVVDWGRPLENLGVFSAPELTTAAPYDGGVDVYSLGVIAFRVATGGFPGESGVYDVPDAPPGLATLIARMLAVDPNERPTAAEVRVVANELLGELREAEEFEEDTDPDGQDVVHASGPRFSRPRWTPAPDLVITSERAPTVSGEIRKKPS